MKKKVPLTFEEAKLKAQKFAEDEKKLLSLVEKAARKSEQSYEFLLGPWESLQTFLRLLRASFTGKFSAPTDALLMIVAAVIYFVCPFDLIPDSIPVLGLVDDAAVITLVARANLNLISSFRNWESFVERELASAVSCGARAE
jgi:uncharacterized membrane protein YkvA (DUF1232 family)